MTDDIITKDEAIDRMKAGLPCKTRCIGGWYATKWADFDDDENTYCKPPEPRRVAQDYWIYNGDVFMHKVHPDAIHAREVLPGDVVLNKAKRAGTVAHFEGNGPSVTGVIWVGQKPEPGTAVFLIGEGS